MKRIFTLICFTVLSTAAFSQIYWNFGTTSAQAGATSNSYTFMTVSSVTTGNAFGTNTTPITTTSASSGYGGASGDYNIGVPANIGGYDPATSAFFEFTLTPTAGSSVILTSISFGTRSTGTGPLAYSIRTSSDAFANDLANGLITVSPVGWQAKNNMGISLTTVAGIPLVVRIYGFNGTGSPSAGTINWRIDDLTINGSALPLKLSSFTGEVAGNNALLKWSTTNEVNVKGFAVEKSSDALRFNEINFVSARNATTNTYQVQDVLNSEIAYYRLKMVDKDGSFTYSKTVAINTRKSAGLSIYPNPAISSVNIKHPQSAGNATLQVVDLNGRLLKTFTLQQGISQTSIDVADLTGGAYLVIYQDEKVQRIATQLYKK